LAFWRPRRATDLRQGGRARIPKGLISLRLRLDVPVMSSYATKKHHSLVGAATVGSVRSGAVSGGKSPSWRCGPTHHRPLARRAFRRPARPTKACHGYGCPRPAPFPFRTSVPEVPPLCFRTAGERNRLRRLVTGMMIIVSKPDAPGGLAVRIFRYRNSATVIAGALRSARFSTGPTGLCAGLRSNSRLSKARAPGRDRGPQRDRRLRDKRPRI
jgi:hypothetical protein